MPLTPDGSTTSDRSTFGSLSASPRGESLRSDPDDVPVRGAERALATADVARLRLLADAGTLLDDGARTPSVLERVGAIAVPRFASSCVVELFADGEPRCALAAFADAERARRFDELRAGGARWADGAVMRSVRSGEPVVAPDAGAVLQLLAGPADESDERLRAIGWSSVVVLPLRAGDRTLGAMILGTAGGRAPFGAEDVALARELARRVSLALDMVATLERSERARAEAESANRAKMEFLATISHELRTPLTAISGYTELLLDQIGGPLTEEQKDQMLRIRGAGQHLLGLVEEVLAFARLQAGRAEVHVQPTDACAVAESAANLVRPMAERKAIVFECRLPGDRLPLQTDGDKLRQIVVNLLANAVKFTEEGTVRLTVAGEGSDVVFVVTDTGPGVPPGQLEAIFEPFRQADQSLTRRVGGAGLGLALARRLARLLGGDVTATSRVGIGSAFTARVPRQYRVPTRR